MSEVSTEQPSDDVIVLTKDPKVLAELEEKLGQYRVRLKLNDQSLQCIDAGYKKRILSHLLGEGSVDSSEIREECIKEYGDAFRQDLFSNAILVIGTYNEMGIVNIDQSGVPNHFELSQDPIIQQRLRTKRAYYQTKLDSKELSEEAHQDTYFKHLVLCSLIENGYVDGYALKTAYLSKMTNDQADSDFNNALGVVFQYNLGTITKLTV